MILICGTLCKGHGHRPLCTTQTLSHSLPPSHTAKAHSPLHQGSPSFSSNHPSLSKVTHSDKDHDFFSIWNLHILNSSGTLPQGQNWAPATHLVPTAGVQLWPAPTSLPPLVSQLDEVCWNIPSSGSWSFPDDGSLPALPSNKAHLTLFNSSHWNTHAENDVLPTLWALKLLESLKFMWRQRRHLCEQYRMSAS